MKKISIALLAVALALAIRPAAKADTYNLTFHGTGTAIFGDFGGSGILITTGAGGLVTNITGGSFTYTGGGGGTLTATLDKSSVSYYNIGDGTVNHTDNDVVTPPASPNLDSNGLALTLSDGYTLVLADDGSVINYVFSFSGANGSDEGYGHATITQVTTTTPEPGSLFLLGSGMLGLAFALFWKAKPSGFVLHM